MYRKWWIVAVLLLALWPGPKLAAQEPIQCSTRELLSVPNPNSRTPGLFSVTVTSTEAVFLTYPPEDRSRLDLNVIALDGESPARQISADPEAGVVGYEVAPDGSQVVFMQHVSDQDAVRLYVVPLDGSTPPRLLPDRDPRYRRPSESVYSFGFTPDGSHVILHYRGDLAQGLASIDLAAGELKILDNDITLTGIEIFWDATNDRVIYTGPQLQSHYESQMLYSVPVDGSTLPVRLDAGNRGVVPQAVAIAGDQVVYQVVTGPSDQDTALYLVPLDGSAPPRPLDVPTPWWPPDNHAPLLSATADGRYILYVAYISSGGGTLRAVTLDVATGKAQAFRLPIAENYHFVPIRTGSLALAGDGNRAIFSFLDTFDRWQKILFVPDNRPDPIWLEQAGSILDVSRILLSPSMQQVLYVGEFSLKLMPLGESQRTLLTLSGAQGRVDQAWFVAENQIVYVIETSSHNTLYVMDCH